jgi:selenide, water dikinase
MNEAKKLTQFSKSSGCGCKIEPKVLQDMLGSLNPGYRSPHLLVGSENADDASVYDLGNGLLLLQSTDFFTPIVDDAYLFGQIAASNALSDIWAMGGKPIMANVILGWPLDELGPYLVSEVMQGALDICTHAGVSVAGGHSIDIPVPIFGLSVTGTCHKNELKTNKGAKSGDTLLLTKPLGIGILSSALKKDMLSDAGYEALRKNITQLNTFGGEVAKITGVHAMTDITGFGFVGHLLEMCKASDTTAHIDWKKVPLIEEAKPLAAKLIMPDNAYRNWNACQNEIDSQVDEAFPFLCDPQTNGGLLLSVDAKSLGEVMALAEEEQAEVHIIGRMVERGGKFIVVE